MIVYITRYGRRIIHTAKKLEGGRYALGCGYVSEKAREFKLDEETLRKFGWDRVSCYACKDKLKVDLGIIK
jgi:hypothetical protein